MRTLCHGSPDVEGVRELEVLDFGKCARPRKRTSNHKTVGANSVIQISCALARQRQRPKEWRSSRASMASPSAATATTTSSGTALPGRLRQMYAITRKTVRPAQMCNASFERPVAATIASFACCTTDGSMTSKVEAAVSGPDRARQKMSWLPVKTGLPLNNGSA